MIAQFDLHKLSGGGDPEITAKLAGLGGSSAMLQWFAASGNTMTIATKDRVVHLQWTEHVVPVEPKIPAADIRRSASTRSTMAPTSPFLSRNGSISSKAPVDLTPSTSGTHAHRRRRDSGASSASAFSAVSTAPPRSAASSHARGASSQVQVPSTPSRRSSSNGSAAAAARSPSLSLSRSSTATSRSRIASPQESRSPLSPETGAQKPQQKEPATPSGATRYAPNLAVAPTVVEILETADMATGCVDPAKRRIVCSTFSSRAGSDRRLYSSTYSVDRGELPAQSAGAGAAAAGEGQEAAREHSASTTDPSRFVSIDGAWKEQEEALQKPSTRPLAMVVDHESIVVGCQDGTVYRLGFVGSKYQDRATAATEEADGETAAGTRRRQQEGADAVIEDLTELREVWAELMLPPDAPADHPGRLKVDLVKAIGLK